MSHFSVLVLLDPNKLNNTTPALPITDAPMLHQELSNAPSLGGDRRPEKSPIGELLKIENFETRVHEAVAHLMEPYSELIDVEPYDRECSCKGWIARRDSRDEAVKQHGHGFEVYRETYWRLPAEERTDERWKSMIKDLSDLMDRLEQEHSMFGMNDPECESCNGTGIYKSTYNPKSKWDWWVIGGRWSGYITNVEHPSGGSYNDNIAQNTVWVDTVIETGKRTFAIITPDGVWRERGEMGWFAIVTDEKDEEAWDKEYAAILEAHRRCIAVCLDCHI